MRMLTDEPTLVEQVFQAVLSDIIVGRRVAGSRLVQDDIAAALDVSRQPVQQALLLLRSEGFVVETPGHRLAVAPIDIGFVRDIYEVRAVTEGLACRLAALRNARRAREEGPALIRIGRDAEAGRRIPDLVDADMTFHKFLNELSGNTVIGRTTGPSWHHLQRVMAQVLLHDRTPRQIWDQHETILEAVARGDAETAEREARLHINVAAETYSAAAETYLARLTSMRAEEPQGSSSPLQDRQEHRHSRHRERISTSCGGSRRRLPASA